MHVGRSYRLIDFVMWSRRSTLYMLVVSALALAAWWLPPLSGFSLPWSIVVMLGTSVALVSGFKNGQVLQRSNDALQVFYQIAASSRLLASYACDFLEPEMARRVIHRHLGWLTALRYQLRQPKPWESAHSAAQREFRKRRYEILEDKVPLATELERLLGDEARAIGAQAQPAVALLYRQSEELNALLKREAIVTQAYSELQKIVRDCHDFQSRAERIKNAPYPRQYAIVSAMFVSIFCTLMPFGVVPIFAEMGKIGGLTGTVLFWLGVPFSVLVG